jgi:TolB protein
VSVTGGGSVVSTPGGIDCGGDCSQAFPAGAHITLTAKAKRGFRFGRWRGACAGKSATCALTLGSNAEVEAGFVSKALRRRPLRRRGLILGTNHSDVLKVKGRKPVVVYGLGGNDKIIGGKRNDVLIGGTGKDKIKGGKGRDLIVGGSGNDRAGGGPGNDKIVGGLGRDRLLGGPGKDTINPGGSVEAANGGSGKDTVVAAKKPTVKQLLKHQLEKFLPLAPPIAYAHGPGVGGFEKVWALEPGAPGKLPAKNETITDDARGERHPSWSPSGFRLAYQGLDPAATDYDIFAINGDGSGKKNLTGGDGVHDVEPAWAPDGKHIAFIRDAVLHIMKSNGTDVNQLTPSPSDFNPSWSPDGQKIYFARTPGVGEDLELFSINPDGSGLTQITANDVHDDHPALSPDGKLLAWDAGLGDAPGPGGTDQPPDILVRPLAFPFPLKPAPHPLGDVEPAWSPNGKKLVFHSERDGRDLWLVNLNGSGLQDLTSPGVVVPGHDVDPAWRW